MSTRGRDLRLDDILDEDLRNKVDLLSQAFPFTTIRAVRDHLMACDGNIDDAGIVLMGEQPGPSSKSDRELKPKIKVENENSLFSYSKQLLVKGDDQTSKQVKDEVENDDENSPFVPQRPSLLASYARPMLGAMQPSSQSLTASPLIPSVRISTRTFRPRSMSSLIPREPTKIEDVENDDSDFIPIDDDVEDGDEDEDNKYLAQQHEANLRASSNDTKGEELLKSIADESLRKKVEQLHDMLPGASVRMCLESIRRNGGSLTDAFLNADAEGILKGGDPDHLLRRSLKRGAEIEKDLQRAAKKARTDDEKAAAKLISARAWVDKYFQKDDECVHVILQNGTRWIPRQILSSDSKYLQSFIDVPQNANTGPQLQLNDVSQNAFDLLLQWLLCKNITPVPRDAVIKSVEIDQYLDFVVLADRCSITGPALLVEERLEDILKKHRNALEGSHIRKAYTLPRHHPVRALFLKAAVRPFLEHRNNGTEDEEDMFDSEDAESRRVAFGTSKFAFKKERETIPEFKSELFDLVSAVTANREYEFKGRRGKKQQKTTYFMDPLTDDRFTY